MGWPWSRTAMLVAPAILAASCTQDPGEPSPAGADSTLAAAFSMSAEKTGVPRDLLVAIAHVEDGLALPCRRSIDVDNDVPAAGPLQLRRGKLDTLRRGAELSGASEIVLRTDADLALEAGALVLAELGEKTGAERGDALASWSRAVEEMSGFADEAHRENYVHRVFATLARGGRFEGRDGEIIELAAHDLPPSLTLDVSDKLHTLAQAQYPGAEWIPTSCKEKCSEGRDGLEVELIVIHDTEGNWNASVATLQNDPDKSVQYIVDVDGKVGQFVTEETTAWHAGNFNVNRRSVGIEHVGFASKPFPEALYSSSAKLVDHLAAKYDVPRDRAHIIGHDQVPNGPKIGQTAAPCSDAPKVCQASSSYGGANHHTDPGIWDWATFMPRFGGAAKCNDAIELWRCDHSKTRMFRCASGAVEVQLCPASWACRSSGEGADDVCVEGTGSLGPSNDSDIRPAADGCAVVGPLVARRKNPPAGVRATGTSVSAALPFLLLAALVVIRRKQR